MGWGGAGFMGWGGAGFMRWGGWFHEMGGLVS